MSYTCVQGTMEFFGQEYWSGLPFASPGDLRRDQACVSCIGRQILYHLATWEALLEASSVQFSSVAQSRPTLCDPMNRSMPGFPVYHQLPEFTQTHVHRVGDAIQSGLTHPPGPARCGRGAVHPPGTPQP